MAISELEVRRRFDAAFSLEFQLESLLALFRAYREAYAQVASLFARTEVHDLLPNFRRAAFERDWRTVIGVHRLAHARVRLNEGKNCYHTLIETGPVALTTSAVRQSSQMVRSAEFRKGYAASAELSLFLEEVPPPPGAALYGILIHGRSKKNPALPGFAVIRFPDPNLKSWVGPTIDLMTRHRHILVEQRRLANETLESYPIVDDVTLLNTTLPVPTKIAAQERAREQVAEEEKVAEGLVLRPRETPRPSAKAVERADKGNTGSEGTGGA